MRELTGAFNDTIDRVETERRDSARRALAAQGGERATIAREMHDEIGPRRALRHGLVEP